MPDTFTETSRQSWFSRIAGSFFGALIGIVLLVVAFPLLWWNEGRAVRTAKGLTEGAGAVVSVQSGMIDASREGAVVHVTGLATTSATVTDEEFGISAPALKLVRTVEMFQWREDKKSESRKNAGGSETTKTTYTYRTGWSESVIDSSDFKHPDGHQNPVRIPWASKTVNAETITLGAFTLPPDLVAEISAKAPLAVDSGRAGRAAVDADVRAVDGGFYRGKDPAAPAVGDLRIRYEIVKPQTVSIVAVQRGSSFDAYRTKTGTAILMLEAGDVAADAMFKAAQSSNRVTAWLLRGAGWLLMFFGLFLVFRPIAVLGSVLPLLGRLVSGGIGFVSFFVALALSLITMSLAWMFYRPVLAIGLLALAVVSVFLIVRRRRAIKSPATPPPLPQSNTPRMTPPPLPPPS